MTKARMDGLTMLIVGCVFFAAIGIAMEKLNPMGMTDFEQIYASSRCVAHHCDPYNPDALLAFYQSDTGGIPTDSSVVSQTYRRIVFIAPNLPTTLFLIAPIAALPWKMAVAFWMLLIAGLFIAACFQVWSFCGDRCPRLCGALLCLMLVNSGLLLSAGNTAGLVVSLTVIGVGCFLHGRFGAVGVVCMAVALAMKPHDAGPIWLFLLLAGGTLRKRALQAAMLTALVIVPAILWVAHASPHWFIELQANLARGLAQGGLNNPGPTTQGGRGIGQIVSLQAVLSLIRDDARFYNPAAYLICAALLLPWCFKTWKTGNSPRSAWFALAAIAVLTMLPFYHRTYDARLLVLAVPACAVLWSEHRLLGRWALALTVAALVLTGDLFWVAVFAITHYSGVAGTMAMIVVPLALLALAVFYVSVYLREPRAAEPV